MKIRELLKLSVEELQELNYISVKVTYIDKSIKTFDLYSFDVHKNSIIENLLNQIKIKFQKESLLNKLINKIIPKHNMCRQCKMNTLTLNLGNDFVGCHNCGYYQKTKI